jgi:hypothetical protein
MKPVTLNGPKILIEGPSGTGKSYSIGTLVDWAAKNEFEVFCLYTENSLETLLGYWTERKLPVPTCLHYHVNLIPALGLASLIAGAKDAGTMSYELLTKMSDPNRSKNNPWEKFLTLLTDFPDDRTGQKFGNIGEWPRTRILVIDSLTEAAIACFRMVTGNKPVASQPDYQVAQNNLIAWIRYMTQSLQCTWVLTAHVGRQVNEITGTTQLMTKAIGKALADDIPQLFSETLYCKREGEQWWWDTKSVNADTKTRYLPISDKIKPDFGQIMDKWLARATA